MPIRPSASIEVKYTARKGRGVFATQMIPKGTEFERVPVLVMRAQEVMDGDAEDLLPNYVFEWGKDTVALALGFGSLYNHSYSPNARYDDVGRMTKVYTAVRDIQPGEEITINYNGSEDDLAPVGFDVEETPTQVRTARTASRNGKLAERSASASKAISSL
ncbi:MAG: SET domain-containing protein [Planctomycetaceae bacterium]